MPSKYRNRLRYVGFVIVASSARVFISLADEISEAARELVNQNDIVIIFCDKLTDRIISNIDLLNEHTKQILGNKYNYHRIDFLCIN